MNSGHREIEQAIRSLNLQAESILDAEFLRALRICDAALVLDGPLSFSPGKTAASAEWDEGWQTWLNGPFAEAVAPALLKATDHARAGQYREIVEADQALGRSMNGEAAVRSARAGSQMLRRLAAARGVRWLDRLQAAVEENSTPGHFAVVYGCQGALFHLNPRVLLATCVYWEWAAAAAAIRRLAPGAVSSFQTVSAPVLRRITDGLLTSPTVRADESSRASF